MTEEAHASPKALTRPRRQRTGPRGARGALAAGATIAVGTQAYGVPVRYENPPEGHPDHFEWQEHFLDLTKDAASQANIATDAAFFHIAYDFFPWYSWLFGWHSGATQIYGPAFLYVGPALQAGEPIPTPGVPWNLGGLVTYYYYTNLPVGQETYLGFRFDLGKGIHYAWAKVLLNGPHAHELDALAWGYETEPGVPVAAGAPEPGSLAALAVGALMAGARRRGRD